VAVDLDGRRQRLRSLHVPGKPLVLPNAWDAGSARAVVAAGFPVAATTSAGVAEALGYEDYQGAPAEEMFAAAARIVRAVDVPVTMDSEAGYGLEPAELVEALRDIGAAGCNLEDTDHETEVLRDVEEQAAWLRRVREQDDTLVINARIDVFLTGDGDLSDALRRAKAYFDVGVDCVYPITLSDRAKLERFVAEAGGPVNVLADAGPAAGLAALGVARISYGGLLYRQTMEHLAGELALIPR
jgi:2-methylisocitrate lyase-like PEP mutase family enzyme